MEHTHHTHENTGHHEETISNIKSKASKLELWLVPVFAKAPHLPEGGRRFLTAISPWLSLIFGLLALTASLGMLIFSPFLILSGNMFLTVSLTLGLFMSILSILAFKPLQEMKKTGWNFLFYSLIISVISTILGLIFTGQLGRFIWIFVELYLLFEIRSKYK